MATRISGGLHFLRRVPMNESVPLSYRFCASCGSKFVYKTDGKCPACNQPPMLRALGLSDTLKTDEMWAKEYQDTYKEISDDNRMKYISAGVNSDIEMINLRLDIIMNMLLETRKIIKE